MADYGPGYDPSQADHITARDQAIGAVIGLTAFAAIGIGAYLAFGAAVTTTVTGDLVWVGLTAAEAAQLNAALAVAAATRAPLSQAMGDLVTKSLLALSQTPGGGLMTINALITYNYVLNQSEYNDFIAYLISQGYNCHVTAAGWTYCVY